MTATGNEDLRTACRSGVAALADWAARVRDADVPRPVLQRAARVLADDLGAIVGARDEPEVAAFHRRLLERAGRAEATLFRGGRQRTDRVSAAVGNAVAADWLELDEGYRVTPCHAGLYVLPALLAEAEARDLPLAQVLRILAVSYEIVTRIARAFPPRVLNLHSHARYAAVGACAATALAGDASASLLRDALNAAATLVNVGPRNHLVSGALVRNVWPAMGAWAGMMSVEWAQCGIAGAADGFHDVYAGVLGSEPRPEALTADLGRAWAVDDGYMKLYACCQHLHSAVEATLDARSRMPRAAVAAEVDEIFVEAHPLALLLPNAHPATTLGAKFSLPHALAAAVSTGTGGAEAFASASLDDPTIAALRVRVRMAPLPDLPPPPHDRAARVTLRLRDGTTSRAQCLSAQGSPDRPFPPEVLLHKLETLCGAAYPRLPAVLAQILALDDAWMAEGWESIVARSCA